MEGNPFRVPALFVGKQETVRCNKCAAKANIGVIV